MQRFFACFYLTDEECKWNKKDGTTNEGLCFYLTDEECKYGKILFDDFVIQGVFI